MILEVGEHYLTEDARIIKISEQKKDYFLDNDDYIYSKTGVNDDENTERNTIAHIPKQLLNHLVVEINNYHTDNEFKQIIDNVYGETK